MIQGDFTSDFAGKEAVAATPGRPQPSGTVRVQTYATQTTSAIWVDAPYGIYSPKEIPEAYQDRIMESGKAFQWRNPRVPLGEAAQREMERGANAGELTVRDMRNLAQGAGRNMNIRVAMAKIGNDFRFVGYDMSVGSTGQPVSGGFVETEAGTTRGVGQALFVDRVVRALSNRAEGMQLEVYHSQRTENFHARIFAVAGRQGTPTEGQHYTLSTGEMIRVALAWSEKLTVAQRQDLTALLARRPNPTALEADAALWRGSAVRPGGTQRVPSSQTVTGVTGSGATSGGRGGAVQPIAVPEPAVRSAEKRSTLAAGAIALLSMQLGSIRNAERAKAVARLQELGPRIDELRGQGFGVVVTLIVEVPNQIDIAAIWAGIGDVTQVVYYNDMFISYAGPPIKEQPPIKGQRQPQAYRQNYAIGDTDYRGEWYRHHPRKGFRFATSHLQLPAERGLVAPAERKARPILVMRPDKTPRSVHFGADYFLDVNRRINISSAGFEMWNTVTGQRYQRIDKAEEQGRGNAYPSRAKFIHDVPGRPNDRHSIESTFQYSGLEITEYTTFRVLHDKFRDRDDPSITPSEAQVHWVLDQVLWEDMQ
jgi:hypothetical protein